MSLFLANGQRSNDVAALQSALNGALTGVTPLVVDGIFGAKTEAAVRAFQARQGLKVDGIAGPKTLDALFEGVEVGASLVVTRSARPVSGPSARPPPPGLSFGVMGLMLREATVDGWLGGGFPKPDLSLSLWSVSPGTLDLPLLRSRGLPVQPLLLPKRTASITRRSTGSGYAFQGEFSASTSDLKEVKYDFSFKAVQPKSKGFFQPGVSLSASPDGGWTAATKVSVTPFRIPDIEWGQFTFSLKPGIAASLTTPLVLGAGAEAPQHTLKLDASLSSELVFRPLARREDFELFFGGKLGANGFLKFKQDKIEGGFVAPDFKLNAGVRFMFKGP